MKKLFLFLAFAILLVLPGISSADAAAYLKIADIKGESTDKGHKEWIEILSVSGLPSDPAGSAGTGERQRGSVMVTRAVDKASAKLQEATNSGKVFPMVIIETSEYGGSRATYLKYELTNVRVISYSVNEPGTSGEVPMESFSLNYTEIKFKYDEKPARAKRK